MRTLPRLAIVAVTLPPGLFTVKIVTPAQFTHWIKTQQALQDSAGGAQ
jgi:hypothetical protein